MDTYESILKDLKNKIYKPIYLLQGEEPYYIDLLTKYISDNVLNESEKTFNLLTLYGKDTDVFNLIDLLRKFPMMANYQVVIVKEAQDLQKIDMLLNYTNKPLKSTILVLAYKYAKIAKNTKLFKSIAKEGIVLDTKKLYENQASDWINKHLRSKDCTIAPEASTLLVEYLGTGLSKISNELEKLIITLPESHKHITTAHIEKNIGISQEYNTFELTKALGEKNILKANRIVTHFTKNPKSNPTHLVLTILFSFFRNLFHYHFIKDKSPQEITSELKINPYLINNYKNAARHYSTKKIFKIFGWLRDADTKSKGINNTSSPDGELLKELVFKILH